MAGPISGRLSDKFGQKKFMISSLTLTSLFLLLLLTIDVNTHITASYCT
ncbi:MAG: hypothetical protein ACPLZF_05035 [Nitrososphaeria archaeon]